MSEAQHRSSATTAPDLIAPLAAFGGEPPPAPEWFSQALAQTPENGRVSVRGAGIEWLAWGERGKPGLLLLHGASAHAHWWSHIAPFFSGQYRVAALSWSGAGGSDWRESYSIDHFAAEILAVAAETGLFEHADRPVVVGHSFGGVILAPAMKLHAGVFGGAVIVDSFLTQDNTWHLPAITPRRGKMRVYPDLSSALARFRFTPPQPCPHPFIADHFARHALRPEPLEGRDEPGWTWRFDPQLPGAMSRVPLHPALAEPGCPLAFIAGECSQVTSQRVKDYVLRTTSCGTPWIDIPQGHHHLMMDQPIALVAALRALFASWPRPRTDHQYTKQST